jgi:hypothetical protein
MYEALDIAYVHSLMLYITFFMFVPIQVCTLITFTCCYCRKMRRLQVRLENLENRFREIESDLSKRMYGVSIFETKNYIKLLFVH